MRLELFFRTSAALRGLLDFCVRHGVTGQPACKAALRRAALLDAIRVTGVSLTRVAAFSVHEFDRTAERTLVKLRDFVAAATEAGNWTRSFWSAVGRNAARLILSLRSAQRRNGALKRWRLGSYNPYLPARRSPRERQRLGRN